MPARVLIAHRDPQALEEVAALCRDAGYLVLLAESAAKALEHARREAPELALLDQGLLAEGGPAGLARLEAGGAGPSVVALVASAREGAAALAAGARAWLAPPLLPRPLRAVLANALEGHRVRHERDQLRAELGEARGAALVGTSTPLRHLLEALGRVAATPRTTVLITGEPGSGREAVARAIHQSSARRVRPFAMVRCADGDRKRLEAEMFGPPRRPEPRPGLLERVRGGTLYLHEVAELGPRLQTRLAELLEERSLRSGQDELEFDVRVIASTSRDLAGGVEEGRFREDLYYRLNVLSLAVPPLRERREDVPLLARRFLAQICAKVGRPSPGFAQGTLERLTAESWPGNVRQLWNALERGVLSEAGRPLGPAELGLPGEEPLPPAEAPQADSLPLSDRSLRAVEEALIRRVLLESGGNRSRAARVLGINRTTLYNKLRAYGIRG